MLPWWGLLQRASRTIVCGLTEAKWRSCSQMTCHTPSPSYPLRPRAANGYAANITEMIGKRIAQDNANQSDQRRTAHPENAWKATSQPKYASKHNTVQDSAKPNLIDCPSGHNDKGTADHALRDVPDIPTAICTTDLRCNPANTSATERHQVYHTASLSQPNNRGVATTTISGSLVLIRPGADKVVHTNAPAAQTQGDGENTTPP